MSYTVLILRRAQKELAQVPKEAYENIRDSIRSLGQELRLQGSTKLTGREG